MESLDFSYLSTLFEGKGDAIMSSRKQAKFPWSKERCQALQSAMSAAGHSSPSHDKTPWLQARRVARYFNLHARKYSRLFSDVAVYSHIMKGLKGMTACQCADVYNQRKKGGQAFVAPVQLADPPPEEPLTYERVFWLRPCLRSHRVLNRASMIDCSKLMKDINAVQALVPEGLTRHQFIHELIQRVPRTRPWADCGLVGAHVAFGECECRDWMASHYP